MGDGSKERRETTVFDRLGRYRIETVAGRGGMGTVYRARDPALDRVIALKLLRPSLASRRHTEHARIIREAQALARLSHPHVVQIFDVGSIDDSVYIAMEYVPGPTLKEWLALRPRRQDEIVEAFAAAGRGLLAAHRAGLVHRDFKPANVLMGEDGRPRVTDFGLARPLASSSDASGSLSNTTTSLDEELTEAGTVMGTPAYMAPEQHERRQTDPRTDQYAFCVALYEALSGSRPFSGLGRGRDLLQAKLDEDFVLCSGVPRKLATSIARGLSADPADRFATMEDLLDVLQPTSSTRPFRKATVLGMACGAVLVAAAITTRADERDCDVTVSSGARAWGPADRERLLRDHDDDAQQGTVAHALAGELDSWQQRWVDARVATCESERDEPDAGHGVDFRLRCLNQARRAAAGLVAVALERDKLGPWALEAVAALPEPGSCASEAARTGEVPPPPAAIASEVEELQAEIEKTRVLLRAGGSATVHATTEALARRAADLAYEPVQIEAQHLLAETESELGMHQEARQRLESAYFEAHRLGMDHDAAMIAVSLTYLVGYTQANFDEGLEWADHAAAILEPLDDADGQAKLYDVRASVEYARGNIDEADRLYREALRLWESLPGDRTLQKAIVRENLAGVAFARHDYKAAKERYEEVLALRTPLLGEHHPKVAGALSNLAATLYRQGDYESAVLMFERAGKTLLAIYGEDHLALATPLEGKASCLHQLQRFEEAAEVFRRVLAIRMAAHEGDHPRIMTALENLGLVLDALGRDEEAMTHYARALAMAEALYGPEHPQTASAVSAMGIAFAEAGRVEEAEAALRRVLRIREQHFPEDDIEVGRAALFLADFLLDTGDPEQAASLYRRAHQIFIAHEIDPRLQARTELGLGRALTALGDPAEATRSLTHAIELFETHEDADNLDQARQALASVHE